MTLSGQTLNSSHEARLTPKYALGMSKSRYPFDTASVHVRSMLHANILKKEIIVDRMHVDSQEQ